ncbi:MAG: 3-oxoadipate enol-lactonase [Pseudomonadota bacterium]|jgi:3-oxoadipate enol-lactonase
MPLIYLNTLRLNADISGPAHGPALVLLHALGTNLTLWDDILPLLPTGLRILRLDLRGHGASDTPAPPYAMGALIRDVELAMEHFALKDAVVLGLSLGGMVAQGLATKRLDLVRALILSNTAAKIGSADLWTTRIAEVQAKGLEDYATGAMERMFGRNWRAEPGMPRIRAMLTGTHPDGWTGCAAAIAGTDFYTPTAALRLPTLAIAGANDGTTPPDLVRETADLIPGSQFRLIRGAGHFPLVEKPAEYAAIISTFLHDIGHI